MQTAIDAFNQVATHAETIKNDEEHVIEVMDINDMWPQGDIGILMVAEIPSDAIPMTSIEPQLAPGNTQGSRHVLRSLDGISMYRSADATPLDGPFIRAKHGMTVDHPEHGNVTVPPGCYSIVYQRAFAEELRRIAD